MKKPNRGLRIIFLLTMFMITLSGFAQMPIFKRYYIADFYGLGFLAMFFVTHYIHYICAVILLTLTSFFVADYFGLRKMGWKITMSGKLRGFILLGLILSGLLLVIKNLQGYYFLPEIIIGLDIIHLSLVMLYLVLALLCLIFRLKWIREK